MVRLLSLLVPVVLAAAALALILQGREPPARAAPNERATAVRVATLSPTAFTPRVTAYGVVEPARIWDAVAQVPGRVAHVHPDLEVGALLPEGAEIIRIAEEDYALAVREAEANLEAAKAALEELETRRVNTERSLEIERRSLDLKRDDLTRQRDLVARGAASQATLDGVERELLAQQTKTQSLENELRLVPVERRMRETEIAVAESRLETARLNLARTSLRMPFRGRISMKAVEATQFVAAGATLASADDIAAADIRAQAPQDQFARFVALATPEGFRADLDRAENFAETLAALGWRATVETGSADRAASWPARILRTADTIDASSRSVGVIVRVDGPYRDVRPGLRPPLVKGMFVRVTLEGAPIPDRIVIPRAAIRDGRAFVADSENRLRVRAVDVRATQGDSALIAGGLAFGERVVLSDLPAAIEGMLLAPVEDAPIEEDAKQDVVGAGALGAAE
jgi:RND family efflux transporter MFP subunit